MVRKILLICLFAVTSIAVYCQVITECPVNIGFESGFLDNWTSYTGEISGTGRRFPGATRPAVITVNTSAPSSNFHMLIPRGSGTDPYGDFSLDAPNGSDYIIRLGDPVNGRSAEAISYTLVVPSNVEAYSVIFNYAVVLENPSHEFDEQPKFTAKIIDVETNTTTECGSFEFTAPGSGSSIPGFEYSRIADTVLYKSWSPVMINLSSYLGRTIRLEFTTNDCSRGGHFGYAYIDFNENCSIPILGNITCPDAETMLLKAIPGLAAYYWFNAATSEPLGYGENLSLSPIPPAGTKIGVNLTPYAGLGCSQTLYTTITNMYMALHAPPPNCVVDLTSPAVTAGNSSDLEFTYWRDPLATIPLPNPKRVLISGTYYIKGTSSSGCTLTLPIDVNIDELQLNIHNPPPDCIVDLTEVSVTAGNASDFVYTYWEDKFAIIPLKTPGRITRSGIYYIKATNTQKCIQISPVTATIKPMDPIEILTPLPVAYPATIDLTETFIHKTGVSYTYWTNPETTISVRSPSRIRSGGTFYIKGTTSKGCFTTASVKVSIELPDFVIPNTFTPNNDGINDEFTILISERVSVKNFKIFNRWGQIVYQTADITNYWNGLKENNRVPAGVYYWVMEGIENFKPFKKSGYVTVLL